MPVTTLTSRTQAELKKLVEKNLLKRPQTLAQISERIKGASTKQLCRPIGQLVAEGKAVQTKGTPPTYTKKS